MSIKISFSLKIHYKPHKYMLFFIILHSKSFNRAKSFSLKIHYKPHKYMLFFIILHSKSFNRAKDSFHHKPYIRYGKQEINAGSY